jgi:tetratricopeptide (TPR) repeat protein
MKRTAIALFLLALACAASTVFAAPPAAGPGDDELYRRGSAAIDAKKWDDAIGAFREMASKGGAKGDRAWYWLAYAQQKSGRSSDALGSLRQLEKNYPDSKWKDDASALEIEIRQSLGQDVAPEKFDDDELKLLAITSLMHSDQERAVTLLQGILASPKNSEDVKEHALFVLLQSDSPRARPLIESAARGSMGVDLQESALELLGTSRDERNRALLLDVLSKPAEPKIKEAAMSGLMLSGDSESLLKVAKSDPDPEMRETAVEFLAVMNARTELDALYKSEKNREVREAIIDAMSVARNIDWLANVAKTESDPELRVAAIEALGPAGGTSDLLLQIWRSEKSPDGKEAVLDALFVQRDAKALIGLAKSETDRKLRRDIVERIAIMDDPEAQNYMRQFLED